MPPKRPIDALRDGGLTLRVGSLEQDGAILEMYNLRDKRLLSIHPRAIYEIQLPDQIDPGRTNAAIPPAHQRILGYGADHDEVARTFLQAKYLFRAHFFPPTVDCNKAIELSLRVAEDLAAMREITLDVSARVRAAETHFVEVKPEPRRFAIPSVPDLKAKCEMFLQKAKHVVASLNELAKIFYPKEASVGNWPEIVAANMLGAAVEPPPEMHQAWANWVTLLRFVANARNAVEHETETKCLRVSQFVLSPEGRLMPPKVELFHPDTPMSAIPATDFLRLITDQLIDAYEGLAVALASASVIPFAGVPLHLEELPPERRGNKRIRFAYVSNTGGVFL